MQLAGQGFSLVEVLSSCPTNWGLDPAAALSRIKDAMIPVYPLGVLRMPPDDQFGIPAGRAAPDRCDKRFRYAARERRDVPGR